MDMRFALQKVHQSQFVGGSCGCTKSRSGLEITPVCSSATEYLGIILKYAPFFLKLSVDTLFFSQRAYLPLSLDRHRTFAACPGLVMSYHS